MSTIFTEETNQTPQTPATPDENTDFVKAVVDLKGEQWEDPQSLAKGYLASQNHIADLEQRLKEAEKQDYAKELLEQLQSKQAVEVDPPVQAADTNVTPDTQGATSLSTEDIQGLLGEELNKRELAATVSGNHSKVQAALQERFGTDANATVDKKARELGMSRERMDALAGESPEAFLALIGEAPGKETNTSVRSDVNTSAFSSNSGDRNQAYYTNLRQKDRKRFYSPEVQSQMLEDRMRLGDTFYN